MNKVILTIVALLSSSARAQDHLAVPEPSADERAAHARAEAANKAHDDSAFRAATDEENRLKAERYQSAYKAKAENDCATSFPARAAAAQADYKAWIRQTEEDRKQRAAFEKANGPKLVEFFNEHCRFLNGLETAVRKLDDPHTIVCDAPKPKGLTAQIVAYGSVESAPSRLHISGQYDNERCRALDSQTRFSLVFDPDGNDAENVIASQLLLCYQDERPACQKARDAIAKLKAKLAAKAQKQVGATTATE